MSQPGEKSAERLLAEGFEAEGVEHVFGLPGEGNIRMVWETSGSAMRFVPVRHEQAAGYMAAVYGRLSGKTGVCLVPAGAGALNVLPGAALARADGVPWLALSARCGLDRGYDESAPFGDLEAVFRPLVKWAATVPCAEAVPEMASKAFAATRQGRPGPACLIMPDNLTTGKAVARPPSLCGGAYPDPALVEQAAMLIRSAHCPFLLVGMGATRNRTEALARFIEHTRIPAACTFMAKGTLPDNHPLMLGSIGFMRNDYENFALDRADVLICLGLDSGELDLERLNLRRDKKILHIHHSGQEGEGSTVSLCADIGASLSMLREALPPCRDEPWMGDAKIIELHQSALAFGEQADNVPLKPQRIVGDIRKAMGDDDIVLVDSGSAKMWMAKLYSAHKPLTCLFSSCPGAVGFALPGALAAKLARPECNVLAVVGDGAFMRHSQELETALREHLPLVVLIWENGGYGLSKWRMDLEMGEHRMVDFTNPNFVAYAQSMGAKGYRISEADELLPVLRTALEDDAVSVISCPVDYSENARLVEMLGEVGARF